MAWLESDVLAPTVKVRLAVDPEGQAARFARALGVKTEDVRLADWAVRLARGFYPESEGGVDKTERMQAATGAMMRPYMHSLKAATPPASTRARRGRVDPRPAAGPADVSLHEADRRLPPGARPAPRAHAPRPVAGRVE